MAKYGLKVSEVDKDFLDQAANGGGKGLFDSLMCVTNEDIESALIYNNTGNTQYKFIWLVTQKPVFTHMRVYHEVSKAANDFYTLMKDAASIKRIPSGNYGIVKDLELFKTYGYMSPTDPYWVEMGSNRKYPKSSFITFEKNPLSLESFSGAECINVFVVHEDLKTLIDPLLWNESYITEFSEIPKFQLLTPEILDIETYKAMLQQS